MRTQMLVVILLSLGVASLGAQQKGQTIQGHLIDVACGTEKGADSEKAAKHDQPCLMMDDCTKSGFGVMTAESTFYTFDANGNQRARKLIKATEKQADWRVTVVGALDGDTIKVQSLTLDK